MNLFVFIRVHSWFLFLLALSACAYEERRPIMSFSELREENVVFQAQEYTCGAASLATVLGILGRPTTEREVLNEILTDSFVKAAIERGDSVAPLLSAADLEGAARGLGFRAVSLNATSGVDALAALEKLRPIIARVYLFEEYQHFVVVVGVENGWVHLADPAYGNIRLPLDQFSAVWEKGDRVVLAYSRLPFLAWKDEAGGLYVKRDEAETLPPIGEVAPVSLYRSGMRSISLGNSTFRAN